MPDSHPHICDCDDCLNSGPWPKVEPSVMHRELHHNMATLLKFCAKRKFTIADVQKRFRVSYWTARKRVMQLVELQLVQSSGAKKSGPVGVTVFRTTPSATAAIRTKIITYLVLCVSACGPFAGDNASPINCGWDEADASPVNNQTTDWCLFLIGSADINLTVGPGTVCTGDSGRCAYLEPGQTARAWVPLFREKQTIERVYMPCQEEAPVCPN